MSKIEKVILSLAIVLSVISFVSIFPLRSETRLGSVDNGGTYAYKNIIAGNASTTSAISVKGGTGVLGSVVVLKTSATALAIYDGSATTTGATLIATLPASIAAGTYTFDLNVATGLVLAGSVGFTGDYVLTYR